MDKLRNILDASDALDEKLNAVMEAEAFTPDNMKLLAEVDKINHELYVYLLQETASRSQHDRVLNTAIQRIKGMSVSVNAELHGIKVEHMKLKKEMADRMNKIETSKKKERIYIYALIALVVIDIITILGFHPEVFKNLLMFLHSISSIIKAVF